MKNQLAETAAAVAKWKGAILSIEAKLNTANLALTAARELRDASALRATLGDAEAIAAISKARADIYAADQQIIELGIAEKAAKAELGQAEAAAVVARRVIVEQLKRDRIKSGTRLDRSFVEVQKSLEEYEQLGQAIQLHPDLNVGQTGLAYWENIAGFRRVAAAIPLSFVKLCVRANLTTDAPRISLGTSEAVLWNLPPENTKAA